MQVKCKTIILNPADARTIKVTGGTKAIKTHKYENEIVCLEMPKYTISTGETISVKNRKYKVNIIKELYAGNTLFYELYVAKQTKSSLFVLPMLGGERKLFFYNNLLINAFIGLPNHEGCIALLYRWSSDPLFLKFEKAIEQFRNYIGTEDISNDFVMFIFDVPIKHIDNYKKFINGEYSKFDETYKSKILKFHGMNIDTQVGQILYKSEKRKKRLEHMLGMDLDESAELFSIIDDSEIFNPKYYL